MKKLNLMRFLLLFLVINGCSDLENQTSSKEKNATPIIYTTNYPVYFFTKKIAGDAFVIRFPAKASSDPAFWNPTAEEISEMQAADLIFLNGASYENWLANVSLPQSKLVNTSETFKDQLLSIQEKVAHNHGPEGEHEHGGTAFTTWLDLSLAIQQAFSIKEALITKFPAQKDKFEKNFESLENEITILDNELSKVTEQLNDSKVIFSHPVYQYFEKNYEIHGISLHWEPDAEPDDAMWAELKNIKKNEAVKYMIWEDQPLPSVENALNDLGIICIVYNPCGNEPEQGDFLSVMRQNIENLKKIEA